ncbi:MAG: sialidase family protein [Pirellulaceae bacterium]
MMVLAIPLVLVDAQTGTIWVAATWSHGNRSWHGSGAGILPEETGQLMLVHSDDDGLYLVAAVKYNPQIKQPQWSFVLQGPGKGITLRDGTLVFAAHTSTARSISVCLTRPFCSPAIMAQLWQIGSSAWDDTTEAQVVEIEPGVLMLNCRYNRVPARVVMTTRDLGRTWQRHPTSERALIEPKACMASLIDVGREANKDYGGLLLFSNPDSRSKRHRMTIKASPDRGMTWPNEQQLLIDEGASAGYSCMAMIDAQTIGVLYEGSQAQLTFQRIALADIVKGLDTAKSSP